MCRLLAVLRLIAVAMETPKTPIAQMVVCAVATQATLDRIAAPTSMSVLRATKPCVGSAARVLRLRTARRARSTRTTVRVPQDTLVEAKMLFAATLTSAHLGMDSFVQTMPAERAPLLK